MCYFFSAHSSGRLGSLHCKAKRHSVLEFIVRKSQISEPGQKETRPHLSLPPPSTSTKGLLAPTRAPLLTVPQAAARVILFRCKFDQVFFQWFPVTGYQTCGDRSSGNVQQLSVRTVPFVGVLLMYLWQEVRSMSYYSAILIPVHPLLFFKML